MSPASVYHDLRPSVRLLTQAFRLGECILKSSNKQLVMQRPTYESTFISPVCTREPDPQFTCLVIPLCDFGVRVIWPHNQKRVGTSSPFFCSVCIRSVICLLNSEEFIIEAIRAWKFFIQLVFKITHSIPFKVFSPRPPPAAFGFGKRGFSVRSFLLSPSCSRRRACRTRLLSLWTPPARAFSSLCWAFLRLGFCFVFEAGEALMTIMEMNNAKRRAVGGYTAGADLLRLFPKRDLCVLRWISRCKKR